LTKAFPRSEAGERHARLMGILFDFGGTLDADGVAWKERFSALISVDGIEVSSAEFDAAFYRADDALLGVVPTTLDLEATSRRLCRGLYAALGRSDRRRADRVAARFCADSRAAAERNAVLLGSLGRRLRLGVVSNFYGNLEAVCADLGLLQHFDVVIDSSRVGVEKPDRRIFLAALEALQTAAADTLFVGDSLARDMGGARALGMPHAWLRGASARGAPCCVDDPVLRQLSDLENLV